MIGQVEIFPPVLKAKSITSSSSIKPWQENLLEECLHKMMIMMVMMMMMMMLITMMMMTMMTTIMTITSSRGAYKMKAS